MAKHFRKPIRVSRTQLPELAAAGVERALSVRDEAIRELSIDEMSIVSGGALSVAVLKGPIVNGGRMQVMKDAFNTINTQDGALSGFDSTMQGGLMG